MQLLKVLHGSRSRNLHTPTSDYDYKVIYTESPVLFCSQDTRHFSVNNIEETGWELRKVLTLCARSNLSVLEWAHCPVVHSVPEFHSVLIEIVSTFCLRDIAFSLKGQLSTFPRLKEDTKRNKNVLRNLTLLNYIVTENKLPLVQDFSYYKNYETSELVNFEHLPKTKVDKSLLENVYQTFRSK